MPITAFKGTVRQVSFLEELVCSSPPPRHGFPPGPCPVTPQRSPGPAECPPLQEGLARSRQNRCRKRGLGIFLGFLSPWVFYIERLFLSPLRHIVDSQLPLAPSLSSAWSKHPQCPRRAGAPQEGPAGCLCGYAGSSGPWVLGSSGGSSRVRREDRAVPLWAPKYSVPLTEESHVWESATKSNSRGKNWMREDVQHGVVYESRRPQCP